MLRIALAAVLTTSPAIAQTCAPRVTAIETLEHQYSEGRVGIGLAPNGAVIEVYASHAGTWTLFVTGPDGVSCMIASGTAWEVYDDRPAEGVPG